MMNLHARTTVRWAVIVITFFHGAIHFFGAVKGFGWADVRQLSEPIGAPLGVVWLVACLVVVATSFLLAVGVSWWWEVGTLGVVVSQAAILTSWADAKFGTVANVILAAAVVHGYASQGPTSFRAEYRRLTRPVANQPMLGSEHIITDEDLAHLPKIVANYVRQSGAVGQPLVTQFRARIHGRIRGGAEKPWLPFVGEQINTFGREPSRVLYMDATMFGLPVDVLHAYVGRSATMRVKIGSLLPMVNAAGPEMDRAETVTLFNDLCVLAPAALVDAWVTWAVLDEHRVVGTFTNGGQPVSAELVFNDAAELVDFISDDRLRAGPDGTKFSQQRWSTPVWEYATFAGRRVAKVAEARWVAPEPEGEFVYLDLCLDDISYDGPSPRRGVEVSRSTRSARPVLSR